MYTAPSVVHVVPLDGPAMHVPAESVEHVAVPEPVSAVSPLRVNSASVRSARRLCGSSVSTEAALCCVPVLGVAEAAE